MADRIERPQFYEGQVLSAADLGLGVDHARGDLARHNRYLHTPGIAAGLALKDKPRKTSGGDDYVEVELQPGLAVDGTGLAVAVHEPERLSEDLFDQLEVAVFDVDADYPVFVVGVEEPQTGQAGLTGACAVGNTTRVAEAFEIRFGRPGDENTAEPAPEDAPEVTDGPGGVTWPILVGFVRWNASLRLFTRSTLRNAENVGPRYAGVQADEVVARAGLLTLRSRPVPQTDKPAVVVDEAEGGRLLFGLQDAKGSVRAVLTVDASGNVKAEGTIKGKVESGAQFESGIAYDGMLLPLPGDVTQAQVDSGQVALHVQVTPRYDRPPTFPGAQDWVAHPIECRVTDGRRVQCRLMWHRIDIAAGARESRLGAVDYTVVAFVGSPGGS